MKKLSLYYFLKFPALCGIVWIVIAVGFVEGQLIDRDGDGTSDLWQHYYGIESVGQNKDSDGDGTSDKDEAAAGTNPLSKESNFNITGFEFIKDSFILTVHFFAVPTKVYQFQESRDLNGKTWSNIDHAIEVEEATKRVEELILSNVDSRRFIRLKVSDKDEDEDGLSAFDEFVLGTSDQNLNSSGHPTGTDFDAGVDWLSENDPGVFLDVEPSNLHEVDVAWVQQPIGETTPALVVSMTGTGGWYQSTLWSIGPTGVPVEVATTPPQDGHHIKIINLQPDVTSPNSPKQFVTGRIRDDGNLWLHSRSVTEAGGFVHYDSEGYGSNAGVNVFDYAMAQRPLFTGNLIAAYQVVTAILAGVPNNSQEKLRVITWKVDSITGDIIGQQDSGELGFSDLVIDPDEANIQIAHLAENQFVVTYTSNLDALSTRRIEVNQSGVVTYTDGGGDALRTLAGNASFFVNQQVNAVAGITTNGFVTAIREPDDRLKMASWDFVQNIQGDYKAHLLGHNEQDLSPDGNGVHLPAPILNDSWHFVGAPMDHLGETIAVGDFDGDGRDDLAIGATGRKVNGAENAGVVYIVEANAAGIMDKEYSQGWHQSSDGFFTVAEAGDIFGKSLSVGDFNNDGIDDLAVGSPGESISGAIAAGGVHVIFGTPFGLSSTDYLFFSQEAVGLKPQSSPSFAVSAPFRSYSLFQ